MNVRTVCRDEKRLVVVERTPLVKVRLCEVVFFQAWLIEWLGPQTTGIPVLLLMIL